MLSVRRIVRCLSSGDDRDQEKGEDVFQALGRPKLAGPEWAK